MAVMVPNCPVLSSLALCVVLLPAVWGASYSCSSYWDTDNFYHETKQCGSQYCCGDCSKKYCCREKKYQLTQQQQERCPASAGNGKKVALILGVIVGSVIFLVSCVALVICCVTPCCVIYKKCHERRNQRQPTVTTTVVGRPQQSLSPSGYQLFHPGYQPVPVQPGFGNPAMATAPPPSYLEATDPAQFPAPFTQGHPVYPFQPPGEPNGPPPHLTEFAQDPYNPSYGPTPY